MTALGLGCAPIGNLFAGVTDDDARATVDAAWDAGIRYYDTAPLYGVSGTFGPTPQRVELDAAQRGGLFTRLGFLAAYAYATDVDSIHRGAFLNRRLLCAKLPPPPGKGDCTKSWWPCHPPEKSTDGTTTSPRSSRPSADSAALSADTSRSVSSLTPNLA